MSTREAATYLGISYYYLRNLRQAMQGPRFTLQRHARGMKPTYSAEDLEEWANSRQWRKQRAA